MRVSLEKGSRKDDGGNQVVVGLYSSASLGTNNSDLGWLRLSQLQSLLSMVLCIMLESESLAMYMDALPLQHMPAAPGLQSWWANSGGISA